MQVMSQTGPDRTSHAGPIENASRASGETPWSHWVRHLVEMMLAMMVGMAILAYPVSLLAGILGYRDLTAELPGVAALVMAFEMTLPMALWMGYRGHARRGILEMSAGMVTPAIVLVVAAEVGLIAPSVLSSTYHVAMLATMVGLMLYRRADYSGPVSGAAAIPPMSTLAEPGPSEVSGPAS